MCEIRHSHEFSVEYNRSCTNQMDFASVAIIEIFMNERSISTDGYDL